MSEATLGTLFIIALATGLFVGGCTMGQEVAYKQGQIDAINQKIHYQIQTKEDGSTSWERIEPNQKTK